jgi:hypothetical protein
MYSIKITVEEIAKLLTKAFPTFAIPELPSSPLDPEEIQ